MDPSTYPPESTSFKKLFSRPDEKSVSHEFARSWISCSSIARILLELERKQSTLGKQNGGEGESEHKHKSCSDKLLRLMLENRSTDGYWCRHAMNVFFFFQESINMDAKELLNWELSTEFCFLEHNKGNLK